MRTVFRRELEQLPRRLGGMRGLMMLAALALLGALPPLRFRTLFLDPAFLAAYASFAALFAGPFIAQSFAGSAERDWIAARGPRDASDRDVVWGKVLAAALYGWLAFLLILGAALFVLNVTRTGARLALPAAGTLFACLGAAFGLAFLTASAGALISLSVDSAPVAKQLLRLAFFFLVLVLVFLPRFVPVLDLSGLLTLRWLPVTAGGTIALCAALGYFFASRAIVTLADRRTGLSIL
jgi:hypothetical protein